MTDPGEFIAHVSDRVHQSQNTQTLETALGAKAAWGTDPKKPRPSWGTCQKFLRPNFLSQAQEVRSKFKGSNSLLGHLRQYYTAGENKPRKKGVHKFVHILATITKQWPMEGELRHGLVSRDDLSASFLITFSINKSSPVLDIAFRSALAKVYDDHPGVEYQTKGQSQDDSSSNLTVLSQLMSGWVEGHYGAEVICCPEASTMTLPRPRNTARLKI